MKKHEIKNRAILIGIALGMNINNEKVLNKLIKQETISDKRTTEINIMSDIIGEIQDNKYCTLIEIKKIFSYYQYSYIDNKNIFGLNKQANILLCEMCANYQLYFTNYDGIMLLTRKEFLEE